MDEGTLDGTDEGDPPESPSTGLEETLLTTGSKPPSADYEPGDPTHIDRYVVLRRVGAGGMGVVYAAYDNELERRVAIKLVHVSRVQDDTRIRVRREAQAMARLSHPNVVQVYEVGEHEGQVYLAMEFVDGVTLAEWTRAQPPGPERWRAVLAKFIDVGRGLAAAHDVRLVHRDFKPANAIVGDDGRVRVLDFGIARGSDSIVAAPADSPAALGAEPCVSPYEPTAGTEPGDPLSTPLTLTGALMGTPAYMSPEQFEGGMVGARSDQFSFCVALYEALYGERPFAGDSPATLVFAVLAGEVRPAPASAAVPGWIREILIRGLATEPRERWPSMAELLDALGRDPARKRRRMTRVLASASVMLAMLVTSVWFAKVQRRNADLAEAERAEARREEAQAQAREVQAQTERDRALREAQAAAVRARDTARVLAAQGLDDEPTLAAALLADVDQPALTPSWRSAVVNVLQRPLSARVLRGHGDRVTYVEAARSKPWFATSSFDGTARLWPRDGGPELILPHTDAVFSASFDRRGERVVTASRDNTAAIWRVPEQAPTSPTELSPELVLRGHTDMIWAANFSHDGASVVTAGREGTARIWTLSEPERPRVIPVARAIVWWAEFSPDDRWIVACASDGTVGVWSVDEPERPPFMLAGHSASVGDAHFDPTMRLIATASTDGTARLYRFDPSGDPSAPLEAEAIATHGADVFRARFSVEGMRVLTASRDRTARMWTLDDFGGRPVGPARVFAADPSVVWSSDLSPDGRLVALGLGGGQVQIQPVEGGPPLALDGHTSDAFRVRFSPDGRWLYSGSNDGDVRVWSTNWQASARALPGHAEGVTALEQRGRVLVSAVRSGDVFVWPIFDPGPTLSVTQAPAKISGHSGVTTVALDAYPRLLATADEHAPEVRLWRITGTWVLERERPLARLETTGVGVRALALDDAGEILAASTMTGEILVWKLGADPGLADPRPLPLATHESERISMTALAFSPNGEILASGGGDTLVRVWRRADLLAAFDPAVLDQPPARREPPPHRTLADHRSRVYRVVFADDNRRFVSISTDNSAKVWDLEDLDAAPLSLAHGAPLSAADFFSSPEGDWLVTACSDTHAYLWDLADPEAPTLLSGAAGEVRDVEFSPDGEQIAAVSFDGSLRLWPRAGGEPIVLDAGFDLNSVAFADEGRRVAAGGYGDEVMVWYLGEDLGVEALRARLGAATQLCLSAEQRVRLIGQSEQEAAAAAASCGAGLLR